MIGGDYTPSKSHFLDIPSLMDQERRRTYSPGILSPNIPPNPPTSPVEEIAGGALDGRKMSRKLNVNAIPFVPGAPNIAVDMEKNHSVTSSLITKNSSLSKNSSTAVRQLEFDVKDARTDCSVEAGEEPAWEVVETGMEPTIVEDVGTRIENTIVEDVGTRMEPAIVEDIGTRKEPASDVVEDIGMEPSNEAVEDIGTRIEPFIEVVEDRMEPVREMEDFGTRMESVSDDGKSPWPNLGSIQTSGQVTSDSITTNESRTEAETCKGLSEMAYSPTSLPLSGEGVANTSHTSLLSPDAGVSSSALPEGDGGSDSSVSLISGRSYEQGSGFALTSSALPTEPLHSRGVAHSPPPPPANLNYDSFPALGSASTESDATNLRTAPNRETTPPPTADPPPQEDNGHRTEGKVAPIHAKTTDVPNSTVGVSTQQFSDVRNSPQKWSIVSSPESSTSSTPSLETGSTPCLGGAWGKTKSWASVFSQSSSETNLSAQTSSASLFSGNHTQLPSGSVTSRTSSQKLMMPERAPKGAGPERGGKVNGAGPVGGVSNSRKGRSLEPSRNVKDGDIQLKMLRGMLAGLTIIMMLKSFCILTT